LSFLGSGDFAYEWDRRRSRRWGADIKAGTIREIDVTTGAVTTIAGKADVHDAVDGIGGDARFLQPIALVYDGHGSLYVADATTIRRIWLASHAVSTIAGRGDVRGVRLGPLQTARLGPVDGLVVTASGTLVLTSEFAVLSIVPE
jgi:hypothetical protein